MYMQIIMYIYITMHKRFESSIVSRLLDLRQGEDQVVHQDPVGEERHHGGASTHGDGRYDN